MLVILTSIVDKEFAIWQERKHADFNRVSSQQQQSVVKRATYRGRFYDYLQSRVLIQSQTLWYEGFAALSQTE